MSIFKYLRYVFYRAYLWQIKVQSSETSAVLTGVAYVSILLALYSFMGMVIAQNIFKIPILHWKNGAEVFGLVTTLLFYLLPAFLLLRRDSYRQIVEEFSAKGETKKQANFRAALLFSHYVVIFSVTTFLAVWPNL